MYALEFALFVVYLCILCIFGVFYSLFYYDLYSLSLHDLICSYRAQCYYCGISKFTLWIVILIIKDFFSFVASVLLNFADFS